MENADIVFVPKYPLKFRLMALIGFPLLVAASIFAAIVGGREKPSLYLGLLFVAAMPVLWMRAYKKVRFDRSIVLERYLLPPRIIQYASIQDVGAGLLKTSQGAVSLLNCDNVEEFDLAVEESRQRGYWSQSQIKGELLGKQVATAKTMGIAIPVAIVGSVVAVMIRPFGLSLHWLVWFGVIYLPLALGLYAHFRKLNGRGDR